MVDKDLFLHDLAVVAIMKCEGPYLKEWLDYHLMAGVDHFYIYNNESPDNQAEVAAPYVKAGLVTYIPFPGKAMQLNAYNDAIRKFSFQSRYMAFIDGDEFIYPKLTGGGRIIDVVDEILSHDPNAAGLGINWHVFGSNGQEKADYSRGVLERFTRRAPNDWGPNKHIKTLANPRKVIRGGGAHYLIYLEGLYAVNEKGKVLNGGFNEPVTADKIVINHYHCKSLDEYRTKKVRGIATHVSGSNYSDAQFRSHDRNEEFDDGILKYREARAKVYQPPDNSHVAERLLSALERNLSSTLSQDTPQDFYTGKLETFLTCLTTISSLKNKLQDKTKVVLFEEEAIKAVVKSLASELTFRDKILFIRELPKLLLLHYPAVKDLRLAGLQLVSTLKENFGSKAEELSFRVTTKVLSGDLTQAEKNSFLEELAGILELPKNECIAEVQFTLAIAERRYKLTNDFAAKGMWKDYRQAWKDYLEMNHIYELLNIKEE